MQNPQDKSDMIRSKQNTKSLMSQARTLLSVAPGQRGTAELPVGEHQYMVYQMVSDNQAGFNFVLFHPIISG